MHSSAICNMDVIIIDSAVLEMTNKINLNITTVFIFKKNQNVSNLRETLPTIISGRAMTMP